MADDMTVTAKFAAWFRAVLSRHEVAERGDGPATLAEWLDCEREAWLAMQGSMLGHDVDRCPCIGCVATRRGEFNAYQAAANAFERYSALQRRNA